MRAWLVPSKRERGFSIAVESECFPGKVDWSGHYVYPKKCATEVSRMGHDLQEGACPLPWLTHVEAREADEWKRLRKVLLAMPVAGHA